MAPHIPQRRAGHGETSLPRQRVRSCCSRLFLFPALLRGSGHHGSLLPTASSESRINSLPCWFGTNHCRRYLRRRVSRSSSRCGVASSNRVALVVGLLAPSDGDVDLDPAVVVEPHAPTGRAPSPCSLTASVIFSISRWCSSSLRCRSGSCAPKLVALAYGGNVHADEPRLAVHDAPVAIRELHVAFADRFHLDADQLDAGFEDLDDLVVVAGAAVLDRGRPGSLSSLGRP